MALSANRILELLEMELTSLENNGIQSLPFTTNAKMSLLDIIKTDIPTDRTKVTATKIAINNKYETTALKNKASTIVLPSGTKQEQYEWLRDKVLNCEECKKHIKAGEKIVFGVGNLDADILFCGEAPGADEETQGEPFVGRAGQLLTKIISAMGLNRSDVYIANIMNWRPEIPAGTGNRPPTQSEMEWCLPYLLGQIEIVKPKAIVALGATAVSGLLGHDPTRRMRDVRGKWTSFANIPLMITFHPSYILRNNTNSAKRIVWEDMLAVMERLNMPISEKQQKYFL